MIPLLKGLASVIDSAELQEVVFERYEELLSDQEHN
jgi:hypothetical protein